MRSRIAGKTPVALTGAVALGALLRFATLDVQSYDHDEAVTAGRVLQPALTDTLATLPESERTPPLYYGLAWLWSRLFGTGEVGLRSLSALAGTLTVVVVFLAGRRLVSERAGVIAALLAAVNPLLIWNDQSSRSYALGVLLTASTLWATAYLDERPTARRAALWAASASLAVATHYFTAFVVIPAAIWLLVRGPRSRPLWAAALGLAITLGALAPLALTQAMEQGGTADFDQGGIARRLVVTVAQFTVGENPPVESPFPTDLLFRTAGVLVAALAAAAVALAFRSGASRRRGAALGLALAAAGVGVPAAAAVAGLDFYNGRNAMFAIVPLLIATAAGLTAAVRGVAALGAAILGLQLAVVIAANLVPGLQRPDWRGLAERLGPLRPGDAATAPPTGDDPLRLYLDAYPMGPNGAQVARLTLVSYKPYQSAVPDLVREPPPGFTLTRTFRHDSFRVDVLAADRPRRMFPDTRERVAGATALLVPPRPDG
jgi:4-amino-4-deoxy-L-arabinose transferase-like glycosyltransferase